MPVRAVPWGRPLPLCGCGKGRVPPGKAAGNQDTLFCAPLPESEREKDGFLGPRKFAPRRPSAQYYQSCEIAGDIDFIFGGPMPCLSSASCAR